MRNARTLLTSDCVNNVVPARLLQFCTVRWIRFLPPKYVFRKCTKSAACMPPSVLSSAENNSCFLSKVLRTISFLYCSVSWKCSFTSPRFLIKWASKGHAWTKSETTATSVSRQTFNHINHRLGTYNFYRTYFNPTRTGSALFTLPAEFADWFLRFSHNFSSIQGHNEHGLLTIDNRQTD